MHFKGFDGKSTIMKGSSCCLLTSIAVLTCCSGNVSSFQPAAQRRRSYSIRGAIEVWPATPPGAASLFRRPNGDRGAITKGNEGNFWLRASSPSAVDDGSENEAFLQRLSAFTEKNFFLLGMVAAVSFARAFPQLGKTGGVLRPEIFIGNWGVFCIFLLSGLSLELSQLTEAASNHKLNALVQLITFGAWPFLVGLPLTQALRAFFPNLLPPPLLDGLLILSCLPTTVNMCIFLTSACGGNVASALCNAVISNLAGVFLTPALLLRFFGTSIQLPFGEMVLKLANKVLLPVGIGQALRATPLKEFYNSHSKKFKRLQEVCVFVGLAYCLSLHGLMPLFRT